LSRPGPKAATGCGGRQPWIRSWRKPLALAGGLACLLLGGCIYLRLLALKNQLASFDRYFETDLRDGVKITCKQPVLLDEDMAFFHLAPESRQRAGVAERWHFRWVKAYAVPGEDLAGYAVTADFIFVDHKLTRVILPERLFAFVPKQIFLLMVRAFGHAQVDREKRTANANVRADLGPDKAPPRMTGAGLTALLGAPMEKTTAAGGVRWRYRYKAASPDQHSGHIDITFTLDPATDTVRHLQGVVFNARLNLDFVDASAHPPAQNPPSAHGANP
jgi:hypothetical protein